MVGPSGVFVIDSKQWTGYVHQSADGLVWYNHYRLDRTLATLEISSKSVDESLA